MACTSGREENFHARYFKRLLNKVAVSEETKGYDWYGEILRNTRRSLADFFRTLLEESPSNQEATDWWSRKYAYGERVIDDPGPIRPPLHAVRDCAAYSD